MNMSLFSAIEPKQHKVYQDSKTNADLRAGRLVYRGTIKLIAVFHCQRIKTRTATLRVWVKNI